MLYYLEFKNGIKGADAMFFKKAKQVKRLEEKVLRLEKDRDEAGELALETHMKLQALEWEEEQRLKNTMFEEV
ncbi:hypothetical protein BF28_5549 (plasmid) [Bacillus cereus E33L]|uniref:Uncharacterized protein n=2 Tax=Bacillus cereus TaxID=1396 RepID=Q4V1L1_BACCZ|nr:hypothetical protein pE33L466_0239 [Bacillus cereus E33L]AJI25949.1 hypothetical protein BF28_5549 [Bacillus cereus E33L]